jgi:hypothetical protein
MAITMEDIRQAVSDGVKPLAVRIKTLEDAMSAATQYRIDCQKEMYGRVVELEKAKSEQNGYKLAQDGVSTARFNLFMIILVGLQVVIPLFVAHFIK